MKNEKIIAPEKYWDKLVETQSKMDAVVSEEEKVKIYKEFLASYGPKNPIFFNAVNGSKQVLVSKNDIVSILEENESLMLSEESFNNVVSNSKMEYYKIPISEMTDEDEEK